MWAQFGRKQDGVDVHRVGVRSHEVARSRFEVVVGEHRVAVPPLVLSDDRSPPPPIDDHFADGDQDGEEMVCRIGQVLE